MAGSHYGMGVIRRNGVSMRRIARLIFAVCLGMTGCMLAVGLCKFHWLTSITKHLQHPMSMVHYQRESSNYTNNNGLKGYYGLDLPSTSFANLRTRIQHLPFSQMYRDTLFSDVTRREKTRSSRWRSDDTQYGFDTQFLNYMTCLTSVRRKLLLDPYFHRKYLPEVPVLMWSKHYSDDEYDRLSQYHGIYGWQVARANVISSALGLLNTPSNGYMFDKDRSPGQAGCTTCAVIGNGGILNGSMMGKEIDSHDYVFRVNVAITKGHEDDVGSKTSFYCAAFRSLSNSLRSGRQYGFTAPPYQPGIRYVFFPKTEWAYLYLKAVLQGKPAPRNPEDERSAPHFPRNLTAQDIKLVHPDFERYLKHRWVNSSRQNHQVHRPSTGAIMLLLALHTCDKVDVYGFAGSYQIFSEYYYDTTFRKHVSFANHDSEAERALWFKLNDLGVINLYTRE